MNRIPQKLKNILKKFFLIDDTPAKVAGGAAVGIFMGIVPGEGVLSTLLVTTIFRFNRLAGTAGVLASNMWATLATLPLAAYIGGVLFGVDPASLAQDFKDTYSLGLDHFFDYTIIFRLVIPLMVGFIIAAALIALFFFFILYSLLKYKKVRFK